MKNRRFVSPPRADFDTLPRETNTNKRRRPNTGNRKKVELQKAKRKAPLTVASAVVSGRLDSETACMMVKLQNFDFGFI